MAADFSWQNAKFNWLDDKTVSFERYHHCRKKSVYIDAYGPTCHLFVCLDAPRGLSINHRGALEVPYSPVAMFLPPFSLVEWHLPVGDFRWIGYLLSELPENFPQEACYFPWNTKSEISSFNDIEAIFSKPLQLKPGYKEDVFCEKARRAKSFIDSSFTKDHSLDEIARATYLSRASLTRSFRASYGLSPIEYRNRLRVFQSIQKMLLESSQVTRVGYESGFNDYSSYSRKFKQIVGEKPSVFRWQKEADI